MKTFARNVLAKLHEAGLRDAEVLSATDDPEAFGNSEILARIDIAVVRITRDRGQEFVDISFDDGREFFQMDDLEIAMGWETIAQVLARQVPADLGVSVSRFASRRDELKRHFTGSGRQLALARLRRAAADRGRAMLRHLEHPDQST